MKRVRAFGLVLLCLASLLGSASCGKNDESPQDGQTTDTTAPSSPTNLSCTSQCDAATRTFTWTAATDDDSGVDHYLVTIDGGGVGGLWTILGNVTTYTLEAALAYHDGSHTLEVKAVDKAGNEGAAASLSFTCDTTAPTISDVVFSAITDSSATITWATDEASTSQAEYGTSTTYGTATRHDTTLVNSHSIGLSGLSIGTTYHFRVKSKDTAGNETSLGDYFFKTLGTQVGGIVSENTTWTKAGSPYLIVDTVQIPLGVKVTIEPGVVVTKPSSGDMFLLNGIIQAHGTASEGIVFDGGGNSNFFSPKNCSAGTFLDLDYCVVKNGLAFWPATGYSGPGSFSLRHSELANLSDYSYLWYPANDVHIEYNKFTNCGGFSVGTSGNVKVYIRYNLFNGKNPNLPDYADYCIQNWATYHTSQTIVQYNSFVNMSGVVLKLPSGYPGAMTATDNYWGTQDTSVIDSMIYDKNDDITCPGYIAYLPILTAPHPDTPTV